MSSPAAEEPWTPPRQFFSNGDASMPDVEDEPQNPRTCTSVEDSQDTPRNPFSPPANIVISSTPGSEDCSPLTTPTVNGFGASSHVLFPDGRSNMVPSRFNSSLRGSSIYGTGSRPGTAEFSYHSRSGSGIPLRESFTAPPSRSGTVLSTTLPVIKVTRDRMRSTMLSMTDPVSKPWLDEKRDPFSRIAYLVTYGVMFLGVIAGAARCYFGLKSVPLITSNLCMVLDEQFEGTDDSVFGQNGKWLREVQMDGYG
jgi:hypothetical protein